MYEYGMMTAKACPPRQSSALLLSLVMATSLMAYADPQKFLPTAPVYKPSKGGVCRKGQDDSLLYPFYEPDMGGVRRKGQEEDALLDLLYAPNDGGVKGTVTNQQTGQPVTDASVFLMGMERWWLHDSKAFVTTDREGKYRSGPLRVGTYWLSCRRGSVLYERTVQIEERQTLKLNIVLPSEPERTVDKGEKPADYRSWLPCKILHASPVDDGTLLMINRGSKHHVDVSMEGVVLKGDTLKPIEGGGRFKIVKLPGLTIALGMLSSYWPQVENLTCRINNNVR